MLSRTRLSRVIRYSASLLPAIGLAVFAMVSSERQDRSDRLENLASSASLAAASIDLRFRQLLDITAFCASAPG